MKKQNWLRKLTLTAILTAGALVVFVIENQIPSLLPLPGVRLGLANIFTLFALAALGGSWALALMLLRVSLGCLLTGQTMAFFYSLCGGTMAWAVMLLLERWLPERQLWVVSVFGALAHNLGQMAVAVFITGTIQVLWYLPLLGISGIITGVFTGLCAQLLLKRLRKNGLYTKKGRDIS